MRFFSTTLLVAFVAILGGAAHQTGPDWWWCFRPPSPRDRIRTAHPAFFEPDLLRMP
ncbi:MAG TPA: hypothetical protein VIO38_01825 [Rariglobus sp.]